MKEPSSDIYFFMYSLSCRNWRCAKVEEGSLLLSDSQRGWMVGRWVHSLKFFRGTYYMSDIVLGPESLYSIMKIGITTFRKFIF